jgi:hypothetical protein
MIELPEACTIAGQITQELLREATPIGHLAT